ncbi:DUF2834 domain-containing protein [Marinomonas posidonica]|uniref:DUF2834 domain-containing protein n=1 Tax=Marinomonas posidonica (strain CECT 7376 / NCIMB 14433 / IVIA-Po-181) TaxID=491952 RepID=F6CYN2_MARPP|nr:DUF2834 domain-containing protein [Marinomonas posidonica]AEF55714.1 hypothetical protein Mar181_2683 [Marinomonas posidonica IVIA-Po-181]
MVKLKWFYLLLALIGLLLPYGALLPWLGQNGMDLPQFLADAQVNHISLFAWADVLISAMTLIVFVLIDGKKNQIKGRYLAIIGTCTIGVSFGLPFYLYLKEAQLKGSEVC